ncbi:MAG: HEAT repeat domain-containing protein [Chloroflexota bacterium]
MIDSLIRQLQDADPAVRRSTIIALGKSKNPAAVKPLAAVVRGDPDPELRELARKAGQYIRQQTQQQTRPHVSPFTTDADAEEEIPEPEFFQVVALEREPEPEPEPEVPAGLYADEDSTPEPVRPTNTLVMAGRQYNIPKDDQARARQYLDTAMAFNQSGNNAKALKNLTSALGLNPNLINDNFFNSVATAVTGLEGDAAAQVIIDRGERKRFTETAEREQKDRRVEKHLSTAKTATWTDVWFEVIIYSLIVIIGPVFVALVTVESARNLLNLFPEIAADLPPQFQDAQMLATAFSVSSLLPIGIISGISGVISLLIQTVLIHYSAKMLGGNGTWRHLIRLLLGFYNKWLPILFVVLIITIAVSFISAFSPIILCFVLVVVGLALYVSSKTASKIGEAYDFGTGKGCVSLLISLIILGILNAGISVVLAQTLGTALSSLIVTG